MSRFAVELKFHFLIQAEELLTWNYQTWYCSLKMKTWLWSYCHLVKYNASLISIRILIIRLYGNSPTTASFFCFNIELNKAFTFFTTENTSQRLWCDVMWSLYDAIATPSQMFEERKWRHAYLIAREVGKIGWKDSVSFTKRLLFDLNTSSSCPGK